MPKSFDNVQYIPVLYKEFTTIEIDIRDDARRSVPFERGRVTVTLGRGALALGKGALKQVWAWPATCCRDRALIRR